SHDGGFANARSADDLHDAGRFESPVGAFSEVASAQSHTAYLIRYFIQRVGCGLAQAERNLAKVSRSCKVEAMYLRQRLGNVCVGGSPSSSGARASKINQNAPKVRCPTRILLREH